jgi:hypothetical protein
VISCAGKYGGLQTNSEVGQSFVKGALKPNLTYYYFGRAESPDAIMGFDKSFVLGNPDMWYPIVPQSSERIRGLVKMMYDRLRMEQNIPPDLRGFRMVDQNGRYVGDWYSLWNTTTTVKSQDNTVVVSPPQLAQPTVGPEGGRFRGR